LSQPRVRLPLRPLGVGHGCSNSDGLSTISDDRLISNRFSARITSMSSGGLDLDQVRLSAKNRFELWTNFLRHADARSVAEIGVWRGEFAETMLRSCPLVDRYYMIDAWRHLENWNKPANKSDKEFEEIMAEALRRTEFATKRRCILRGRTTEVLDRIPDQSLDFAYIDSDHTLRGITLDLNKILPKMRPNGWIGGDDFVPNIWQHAFRYEPTFVFPYAVYFAEAIEAIIYAPGFNQFLISLPGPGRKHPQGPIFEDRTGLYGAVTVTEALRRPIPARSALSVVTKLGRALVRR
jgi:hypothetical protein